MMTALNIKDETIDCELSNLKDFPLNRPVDAGDRSAQSDIGAMG